MVFQWSDRALVNAMIKPVARGAHREPFSAHGDAAISVIAGRTTEMHLLPFCAESG